MSKLLDELLAKRPWLLADGATGTNLFAMGLAHGDSPESWNLEHPEKVREHYRSFIEAGSDLVLTNTFGGTANRLKLHGLDDRVEEINRIAAELLCEEIAKAGRPIVCAGSVGPTGDLFQPVGPLSHDDGVAAFAEQMRGLKAGGADIVWIETLSSEEELRAALTAAKQVGLSPVSTLSFDTNGRTMMGVTPLRLIQVVRDMEVPPVAFGGNCGTGAPDLMVGLLSMQDAISEADVIVAKANCGIPEFVDGEIRYSGTTDLMADYAEMARNAGARIIGGCCGTTPEHIRAMRQALETRPKGRCPTKDEVIATLGPMTGKTEDLLGADDQAVPARKRRRRSAA